MTAASLILGRYRLDREIAAGGTARVWRARDERLDRWVAVKLLHPHLLPDEASRRRLAAEARAAGVLSHPGIATVFDVDASAEQPVLVMELVEGEPLSAVLARDGAMDPEAAARMAAEVAEALYHAHQRGIVHRDVKPANVILEAGSGRARLIDFGIAHSLEKAAQSLTQTGTGVGTPRYMAPEQLAGDAVGPRTDLWGVGATLFEALTGTVPFPGGTPLAIARQQLDGPPPMPGVDPILASLIASCLSVDVAERPLHAGAMAATLRSWLAGEAPAVTPSLSTADTVVVPVVPPGEALAQEVATSASAEPMAGPVAQAGRASGSRSRSRPALMAVAAVLLAALAVGGIMALGGSPEIVAEPSPTATPNPTPNWRAPLLAAYQEACGEELERTELAGMSREEATAFVEERIQDCIDEPEQKGKGGKGNGGGNGGNGGNGGGRGED